MIHVPFGTLDQVTSLSPTMKGITMGKKLTISLTDRRPVTVDCDIWPIIAQARDWDNQYECQANEIWRLIVRQCQNEGDGRCIVYGLHDKGSTDKRGGKIVDDINAVPKAIKEIANYLDFELDLADRCISNLPSEEI